MRNPLFLALAVVAMAACTPEPTNNEKGEGTPQTDFDKAQALAAAVPKLLQVESVSTTIVDTISDVDITDPGFIDPATGAPLPNPRRIIIEKEIDALVASHDFVMLDSWDQVAWPGCLVRGDVKNGFKPSSIPIFAQRKPFRVNINVVNGDEDVTNSTELIDFASVPYSSSGLAITAINKMMSDFVNGSLPAKVSFDISQIQSYEEMSLKLGLDANAGSMVNIKNTFGSLNTSEKTYFTVNLTQTFFTIYHDGFAFGDLFNENITPAMLAPYVQEGSPLAYVSSVNYGRRYVLLIETTENSAAVHDALNTAFSFGVAGASVEFSAKQTNTLKNMNAKVVVIGGGHVDDGLQAALGDMTKLSDYITDGSTFSSDNPPAPIGMVIKDVIYNEEISSVSTSRYKIREVSYVPGERDNQMRVKIRDWTCDWYRDGDKGRDKKQGECSVNIEGISVTAEAQTSTGVNGEMQFVPASDLTEYRQKERGAINYSFPYSFEMGEKGKLPIRSLCVKVTFSVSSCSKREVGNGTYGRQTQRHSVTMEHMFNAENGLWDVEADSASGNSVPFSTLQCEMKSPETGLKWKFRLNFDVIAEGRLYRSTDGKMIKK